jgi:hypothetical protein
VKAVLKLVQLGIIIMLIGFSQIILAETKNACFNVEGMTCASCAVKLLVQFSISMESKNYK